jgi:hypothetical protein
MISSQVLSEFIKANADGDYTKSILIPNKNKRMASIQPLKRIKTSTQETFKIASRTNDAHIYMIQQNNDKHLAEQFFFQSHPFSDLTLLVHGISDIINVICIIFV